MANDIKLPKLKEGVESVEVTQLLAQPGQKVEKDQPVIEVNADKSTMEIGAPMAGTLVKILVNVGDEIKIGAPYCVIDAGGNGEKPKDEKPAAQEKASPAKKEERKTEATEEPKPSDVKVKAPPAEKVEAPAGMVAASPGTRWLARKMSVDLGSLRGTGPKGRVTEDDVKNALGSSGGSVGAAIVAPPLPDFEKFGPVQRDPLSRVRKLTAQKMATSWSLIPHVTQHDEADITDLEAFRKKMDAKGVKLTVTAFALKAAAIALKAYPTFNASLDLANNQLVLKQYYHIGVAVDTKGGLLVPVIRDVDKKSVEQLGKELTEIAEKARSGDADMKGGTFTITNLGGIGGTGFTPIVNHPEVAILGMSRGKLQPVIRDGQVVPRLILPLSVSYDHRVIDGANAARFTRLLAEMLENPWQMVLRS